MGKSGASSDSSQEAALKKHMSFLAELYEEAIVEMQCQEGYYEGQRRPEPAEDCRRREQQCRRRLAKLQRLSEEVVT